MVRFLITVLGVYLSIKYNMKAVILKILNFYANNYRVFLTMEHQSE